MKKYLHCLVLLAAFSAAAQDFRGTAVYESKTSFDFSDSDSISTADDLPDEIGAEIQEQLKKAFEKRYTLNFDKATSLYVEEEKLAAPSNSNITVSVQINSADAGKHYKNLKEKIFITENEIFGKEFLIADSLQKYDWKLGSETKKIGAYTCYKATATVLPRENAPVKAISLTDGPEKDLIITAWYAPEIPVSHGPGMYWGLPGLILEVNDGHTILLCSKVVLNPKEKTEIKAPKNGKKVSRAEFEKILGEKAKESMEMNEAAPGTTRSTKVIKIGG